MHDLIPTEGDFKNMFAVAKTLLESGFLPKAIDTLPKAIFVMQRGRELGIPAVESLTELHVVDQRVGMSANLMMARLREKGIWTETLEESDQKCHIRFHRPQPGGQDETYDSVWTIQMAQSQGLIGKGNWLKMKRTMLRARAVGHGARFIGGDVIRGAYLPEELEVERPEPPAPVILTAPLTITTATRSPSEGPRVPLGPPPVGVPQQPASAKVDGRTVKALKAKAEAQGIPWEWVRDEAARRLGKPTTAITKDDLSVVREWLDAGDLQRAYQAAPPVEWEEGIIPEPDPVPTPALAATTEEALKELRSELAMTFKNLGLNDDQRHRYLYEAYGIEGLTSAPMMMLWTIKAHLQTPAGQEPVKEWLARDSAANG